MSPADKNMPGLDLRSIPRIAVQAFCETKEVADIVEAAAADRRMVKAHTKVQTGGLAAAVDFYGTAPTPNLVIVESREGRDVILGQLDQLAENCDPGSKVIVIGHINDVILYRELTRRGVSEYMVAPITVFDLIREIGEIYYKPDAAPLGRTVAFVGAKGGCGASTLSHNVAWACAKTYNHEVVLADLDLAFGTAGLDFNLDPTQGIGDALAAPERVDDVYLDRLLAKCAENLHLLAAPATLDRPYEYDEAAFDPIIDATRTGVPIVVLDVPHLWTGWVRRVLRSVDEAVLVCAPDLANLRNAKNLADTLKQARPNDAPPRLVMNMVGVPKRPEIKPEEFAKALGLPITAQIPFDAALFGTASNNGQMIAETDPKSAVGETFRQLAQVVTGKHEIKKARRSPFAPLLARLRGAK
ncbi:AAA family ATPase [Prosthecomicrobium hirschii]|uniref:CtpF protein n=1 Tax=Prosthecodimorpha hirschii TaxID=665126 RepID=A0A0P6WAY4_9HYPH|nr:CtpF protein [Prosthecomicrobium hirschii]KPL54103.1 CtpF protein [Prosthecomicrobium hirschii]MCW1841108.1 CtpF protein [Prosthecomicrobium hirschii]